MEISNVSSAADWTTTFPDPKQGWGEMSQITESPDVLQSSPKEFRGVRLATGVAAGGGIAKGCLSLRL
jgi:hypothetical protein